MAPNVFLVLSRQRHIVLTLPYFALTQEEPIAEYDLHRVGARPLHKLVRMFVHDVGDVVRIVEKHTALWAEPERHEVAMLPGAHREKAERILADLVQISEKKTALRAACHKESPRVALMKVVWRRGPGRAFPRLPTLQPPYISTLLKSN